MIGLCTVNVYQYNEEETITDPKKASSIAESG